MTWLPWVWFLKQAPQEFSEEACPLPTIWVPGGQGWLAAGNEPLHEKREVNQCVRESKHDWMPSWYSFQARFCGFVPLLHFSLRNSPLKCLAPCVFLSSVFPRYVYHVSSRLELHKLFAFCLIPVFKNGPHSKRDGLINALQISCTTQPIPLSLSYS